MEENNMFDYTKNHFYTKVNKLTGDTSYYLKLNNQLIEVSKEVYSTCNNSYQKQLRDFRRDKKYNLISYDAVFDNKSPLLDKLGNECNLIDNIIIQADYIKVLSIIDNLKEKDKILIKELLIDELTESELARKYNVSQQAINNKKRRIIKKIKKDFKK